MSCEVCFENYSKQTHQPKLLPCGHDFCNLCLMKIYIKNNEKSISCPNCNTKHEKSPTELTTVYKLIADNLFDDLMKMCEPVLINCKTVAKIRKRLTIDFLHSKETVNCNLFDIKNNVENIIQKLSNFCSELSDAIEINSQATLTVVDGLRSNVDNMQNAIRHLEIQIAEKDVDGIKQTKQLLEVLVKHEEKAPVMLKVEEDVQRYLLNADKLIKKLNIIKKTHDSETLNEKPDKIIDLDYSPWDAAVITNTHDWSICNYCLVENTGASTAIPAPSPLIFVVNYDNPVLVLDENGQVKAQFKMDDTCLWFISSLELTQKLVLTDYNKKRVYITSFLGEILHRTINGQLRDPRGHCSLHQETQLAVCDKENKLVVILSVPLLQTMYSVTHPTLISPWYPTSCNQYLYVLNCGLTNIVRCRLSDFTSVDNFNVVVALPHSYKIKFYANVIFVSSHYQITQYAVDSGQIITQIGSQGSGQQQFYDIRGFCIFRSTINNKLFVCDNVNKRLKIHSFD